MWQNCSMKAAPAKINTITATCPACGLLCDDIRLEINISEINNHKINVLTKSCKKAVVFFEQPLNDASAQINGKAANLQQAILHAATLTKASQQPLLAGLGTDVAGFRSLYHLSQKTNATLQHMNAQSTSRNMNVLQSKGWQTTTLTEVKNRADVIVCFGDIAKHNPRFFERFVDIDGMFIDANQRQLIFIGENYARDNHGEAEIPPKDTPASLLACRAVDLPEISIALRALVAGKTLKATEIAGVKLSDLQTVADRLKSAKYAVLAWVAKDLDFPHAELTIQNITETVAILNQTTRAAGLPLGGSDGDTTANNANTWLSGFTLNYGALNDEIIEHDLMIWVNSFNADKPPPDTKNPLIVLGNTNNKFDKVPDVFIPIATPGLDSSGTLFRVDSSVILPLKKVRESNLPTLSEVISEIEKLL